MDCLHLRQRCCTPYKSRHTYQLDGVDATSSAQSDVSPSIEAWIDQEFSSATQEEKKRMLFYNFYTIY